MNTISIVLLVVAILAVCTAIYLLCSSEVKYLITIKRNCLMAKIVTKYTYRYIDRYKIDFSWWEDKKIENIELTSFDGLKLKEYIKNIKNVERVELLPYHSMAKEKYKNLGIKYRLENVLDMDKEKCKQLEKLLND